MVIFFGIFIILHGLVHAWYVILSFGLVKYQPDMGWTGESWLFTPLLGRPLTKYIAGTLFGLSGLSLILSGTLYLMHNSIWSPFMLASALFSSIVILLFWDGKISLIIQKGLIGFLINLIIAVALLLIN